MAKMHGYRSPILSMGPIIFFYILYAARVTVGDIYDVLTDVYRLVMHLYWLTSAISSCYTHSREITDKLINAFVTPSRYLHNHCYCSMAQTVNADLQRERQNATFDADQLTYFLDGGIEKTRRKRYLQNLAIQGIGKLQHKKFATLSREEQYELLLQKFAYVSELEKQLGLSDPTDLHHLNEAVMVHEPSGFSLHSPAFVSTVEKLASDAQKEKWLPLMKSFRMVGTYAQTEIGHGSFLRGLETTATYDSKTEEFVIHSPAVSSVKYWPGGLGKTCNSCVVMAQLISKGQNLGNHFFLVQIRDFNTHEPLPGITVGDIGNKFGFDSNDNGFLRFDHFRIPRNNMLMRYSQILPDGTYISPANDRLLYAGMTSLRAMIVGSNGRSLCMAVTIAVRYSAVRRQSEIEPGSGEVQVLDFQTQQFCLFPQIACAYAIKLASKAIMMYYQNVTLHINKGNLEELPILHALSAALKAYSGWICTEGAKACQFACGGHGYSEASGLPKIFKSVEPSCTYEGENTVLMLQTARFLIKSCSRIAKGQSLPGVLAFLQMSSGRISSVDSWSTADLIVAYKHRARRLVHDVAQKLQTLIQQGRQFGDAWNANSVELVNAAVAFTQLYIVETFADVIEPLNGRLKHVMETLWQFYALYGISSCLGDFLQDGFFSSHQASLLQSRLLTLLAELRPNAVALVDAFDYPDAVLDSALGRWDGNVYEALYDYALQSKLNEKQVLDAYRKYQRPFMESQWKQNSQPVVQSHL